MPASRQKIKAVIVLPALHLGGAERQALNFARFLKDTSGAEVQVWSLQGGGKVKALCSELDIPCKEVPFQMWTFRSRLLFQLLNFVWLLRKERVDVLLPYVSFPNLVCNATWRLGGVKACWWQQRDEGRHRGPRFLEKLATSAAPVFVSNSTPGLEFLEGTLRISPSKCHFIPTGVNIASPLKNRATWRSELGISENVFAATMVANLTSFKDHETLLKAWKILLEKRISQPLILLLAGRFGESEKPLKALAYDLELGRSVRFHGAVDDVSGLLAASDLCVFSSRFEGCPNGILEAMGQGLPVVATDIPGIRDAVGAEALPFLVPVGENEAFAAKLEEMICNPDLRYKNGNANKARILTEFSIKKMCEASWGLIQKQLSRRELK
jgi:glycosyltransferase involved in cell wall biosynthesis